MQSSGHLNEEVTNRFKIISPKQLVNHVEILTSNTVEVINAYAPYLCVTIMVRAEYMDIILLKYSGAISSDVLALGN